MADEKNIVNFLFETGMLSKTPRSGFHFLGSGEQSVAEHVNRVCFIGYTLAMLDGEVDTGKILKMCLFHGLPEARTSDLSYLHQKYTRAREEQAIADLSSTLPFGKEIHKVLHEYNEGRTQEALYARDADKLELILALKEQYDIGNTRAETWFKPTFRRLKTEIARSLAEQIFETNSDEWWYKDKEDIWWVTGGRE